MGVLSLSSSVSELYGIGPKKAEKLELLEIRTVYDLISFLPRRYEDWRIGRHFAECADGEECSFYGYVATSPVMNPRSRTRNVSFYIEDDHARIHATFFNSPYITTKFVR